MSKHTLTESCERNNKKIKSGNNENIKDIKDNGGYSLCLLHYFINELNYYERGITDIIKKMMTTYTFKTKQQLKGAVRLWNSCEKEALIKYGHISYWDVSLITDMSELFMGNLFFNEDISRWNVSNVTNMRYLFENARTFNIDISYWDVSNVVNMEGMFHYAREFNQPIGKWDVSKVENMDLLFKNAYSFNQPIGEWNVTNVTNMNGMFYEACNFKQSLRKWYYPKLKKENMKDMFKGALSYLNR